MYDPTCRFVIIDGNVVWYRRDTQTGQWNRIS